MASFKAKFPVLQELFAKNHRGPLPPPPPPTAGRGIKLAGDAKDRISRGRSFHFLVVLGKNVVMV